MKYSYLFLVFYLSNAFAQPNCEAYKLHGDTTKCKACNKAMEISGLYQFSKEYQLILDESLLIDSTFSYAYWAKSIAYLKSGDFVKWKELIDKAVFFDPKGQLGYRGWCRFQFFGDYLGAIQDIEKLDSLVDFDIGFSQNGNYHLNIAKGLCYKSLGMKEKAIEIIEAQILINEQKDQLGQYDYLHLGVLYFEVHRYEDALVAFNKQSDNYKLAESLYYSALTFKALENYIKHKECIEKAKELYNNGEKMIDKYSTPIDKVFLVDIENERLL